MDRAVEEEGSEGSDDDVFESVENLRYLRIGGLSQSFVTGVFIVFRWARRGCIRF